MTQLKLLKVAVAFAELRLLLGLWALQAHTSISNDHRNLRDDLQRKFVESYPDINPPDAGTWLSLARVLRCFVVHSASELGINPYIDALLLQFRRG